MSKNKQNLLTAQREKCDEFYTPLSVVDKELKHYGRKQFENQTILCNCDDPETSNFWKHLQSKFEVYGLKKLISTHYVPPPDENNDQSKLSSKEAYKLEMFGVDNIIKTPLEKNGDFRDPECLELMDQADIVITNPPFSLFREFVAKILEHDRKFLIIGNLNAVFYKQIFPYFLNNNMWLGASPFGMEFYVPNSYNRNIFYRDNFRMTKMGNTCWFTNLGHKKRYEDKIRCLKRNIEEYPKYNNYDAIEVGFVDKIPDYDGKMGVPVTFIKRHNPNQFKLIGSGRTIETTDGQDLSIGKGEEKDTVYARLIIQRI